MCVVQIDKVHVGVEFSDVFFPEFVVDGDFTDASSLVDTHSGRTVC